MRVCVHTACVVVAVCGEHGIIRSWALPRGPRGTGAHQAAEQTWGPQRSCRRGLVTVEGEGAGDSLVGDAWFWPQEPSGCYSQVGPLVGARLGAKVSQCWAKPSLRHQRGVCANIHIHIEGSRC